MGEVYAGPGFRSCTKPGCGWPAVATLGFDYNSRTAWVDEVSPTPDPATYDLCSVHVSRFSPPLGWTTQDRRLSPSRPLLEAAQQEEVPASPGIGDFIQRQPPPEVAAPPRCSRALPESSAEDELERGGQMAEGEGEDSDTPHSGRTVATSEVEEQDALPIAAAAGAHQSLLDLS